MGKNRLLVSTFTVYTCWFLVGYTVTAVVDGYPMACLPTAFAVSLIAVALGAAGGLCLTVGVDALDLCLREREVKGGHSWRGAHVSLGRLPVPVQMQPEDSVAASARPPRMAPRPGGAKDNEDAAAVQRTDRENGP